MLRNYFIFLDVNDCVLSCRSFPEVSHVEDALEESSNYASYQEITEEQSQIISDNFMLNNLTVDSEGNVTSFVLRDSGEVSPWDEVRTVRDSLLRETDWTQLPDVSLATREKYTSYRQALRDITLQLDPLKIVWPSLG